MGCYGQLTVHLFEEDSFLLALEHHDDLCTKVARGHEHPCYTSTKGGSCEHAQPIPGIAFTVTRRRGVRTERVKVAWT